MTFETTVPFDLSRGESITSGYYTPLEVVVKNYLSELESYFFDQFHISCLFDFRIDPAGKFQEYLGSIAQPTPIFVVNFSTLKEDALLVMDNPLANLFLEREELVRQGRAKVPKGFAVDLDNYPRLEEGVSQLVGLFAKSWSRLQDCNHRISKLVSHRIKAKIMAPGESCLKVKVGLSYKGFSSGFEFCFSAFGMDLFLKSYGRQALLMGERSQPTPNLEPLRRRIEAEAEYQATAVLGELYLSKQDLESSLKTGMVLPVKSGLKDQIAVLVNGLPLLSGEPGESLGHQAVLVQGRIDEVRQELKKQPKPFSKTRYPKG